VTVTEPQVWTALGILAAALTGMITLTIRTITVQVQALGTGLEARIDSVEKTMTARFDAVNTKIDGLDRDVQELSVKVFGSD
jgi:hypothetical protein